MAATARLDDITDALQMQLDEYSSFLNCDTGEVVTISHDLLDKAEELEDEEPDLLEWQEDEWEAAKQIASTDRFKQLPTKFDVHEWAIMEEFSQSVKSDKIRKELLHAIHGAGAFRHFKATVRRHGVESDWFAFRDQALRQIAIDWCEENNIRWS